MDLLIPVKVYQFMDARDVRYTWKLYNLASIPYLHGQHVFYSFLAMLVFILFVLFPTLLLLLYPFKLCQRICHRLPSRFKIALHIFVDSFQGCYKDGTDPGTRDFRWFSSAPFVLRLSCFAIYSVLQNAMFFSICAYFFVILALLTIVLNPFKLKYEGLSVTLPIYLLIGSMYLACATRICLSNRHTINSSTLVTVMIVVGMLPIIYQSIVTLHWITTQKKSHIQFTWWK